jgi:DMSO/TMAO reductase YedYZ molybdopterin-dependent catalytic subunit
MTGPNSREIQQGMNSMDRGTRLALAVVALAHLAVGANGRAAESTPQLAQTGEAVSARSSLLEISGAVAHPMSLALDDLRKLPASSESIFFHTGKGGVRADFTGVSLWSLVDKTGPVTDPKARNEGLRRFVVAKGADGYYVVIALAEIDPEFGGQQALVAYEQDGKPLAGARLIMPGDKGGGRNVTNVVSLQLRTAEP